MRPPFCTMVLWSFFSSLFLIIFYFCLLKLTCLLFPWFQLFSNKWNGSMYRQTDGQTNGPTYRDVKLYLKIIVHSIYIYAIYCTSIFRNTRILIEMRGPSCCFCLSICATWRATFFDMYFVHVYHCNLGVMVTVLLTKSLISENLKGHLLIVSQSSLSSWFPC